MPRSHLHTLRLASALTDACIREPYTRHRLLRDLLAGITVGIIAIPLAMALAIASGVPPQHGLYTALIAGAVIALTGGSRFSVSGPTAAFVVILAPIAHQFGLAGLSVATLIAGVLLVLMSIGRFGRLIEYIPESVTLGFTAGIAIVIATLQLKDLLGLNIVAMPEHYLAKLMVLADALPSAHWPSLLVASLTLAVLLGWPRLKLPLPGHLPAVIVGVIASLVLASLGHGVETIGSRFSYQLADGTLGQGIPPLLPSLVWPWQQPGADGQPLVWSLATVQALLPAAFSMAMLGAIESLLCAVVLDGMTGRRHQANGELLGQGLGNLIVPFFGGITATAAIARSAANVRAGAESPVSALIHALVVGAGLLVLAPWLSHLPMASMAALLVVVAWNMSEAHKVVALVKKAPTGDILVLLTCLSLTVLFDMVIAISTGVVIAALLFMRDISRLTKVTDISDHPKYMPEPLAEGWAAYRINGPLFFAAADRVFAELTQMAADKRGLILHFEGVSLLDAGGLSALNRFIDHCRRHQQRLILSELQFQPLKTLAKAGVTAIPGCFSVTSHLGDALAQVEG